MSNFIKKMHFRVNQTPTNDFYNDVYLAFIQMALLYLAHVNSLSQQRTAIFTLVPDINLHAKKLYDTVAKSTILCSAECIEEQACIYCTFHKDSKNCTLFTQGSTNYDLSGLKTYVIDNSTVLFRH